MQGTGATADDTPLPIDLMRVIDGHGMLDELRGYYRPVELACGTCGDTFVLGAPALKWILEVAGVPVKHVLRPPSYARCPPCHSRLRRVRQIERRVERARSVIASARALRPEALDRDARSAALEAHVFLCAMGEMAPRGLFELANAFDPGDPSRRYWRGRAHELHGAAEQARRELGRFLAEPGASADPRAAAVQGWLAGSGWSDEGAALSAELRALREQDAACHMPVDYPGPPDQHRWLSTRSTPPGHLGFARRAEAWFELWRRKMLSRRSGWFKPEA